MEPITEKRHIESRPEVCGGKPCIAGTRIRVWDIHVWHDLRGETPEQIVANFPQLTVADVHAGLAYYLDHRQEIDQQMQSAESFVDQLATQMGPSPLAILRDELLKDRSYGEDSVSSG